MLLLHICIQKSGHDTVYPKNEIITQKELQKILQKYAFIRYGVNGWDVYELLKKEEMLKHLEEVEENPKNTYVFFGARFSKNKPYYEG